MNPKASIDGKEAHVGEFVATLPIVVRPAIQAKDRWEAEARGLGFVGMAATPSDAVRTLFATISSHGIAGRGVADDKDLADILDASEQR